MFLNCGRLSSLIYYIHPIHKASFVLPKVIRTRSFLFIVKICISSFLYKMYIHVSFFISVQNERTSRVKTALKVKSLFSPVTHFVLNVTTFVSFGDLYFT